MPAPRPIFLALCLVASFVALPVACSPPTPTPTPTPSPTPTPTRGELPPLRLPQDEQPHADFQTEWWYFNLQFSPDDAPRYAAHYVVFQVQDLATKRTAYVGQIGLADAERDIHAASERFRLEPAPLTTFDFALDGWAMRRGPQGAYRLQGGAGDVTFDLVARPTSPDAMIHDEDGLVDFGEAGISYYYTRPRLALSGTVTGPDGASTPVSGLGWLDKQWGNFQPVAVSWDWASVQLDDGRSFMLTRLFDANRREIMVYGTIAYADGRTAHLPADRFDFTPAFAGAGSRSETWHSEATGADYPTHWRVRVPDEGIDVTLSPLVEASELVSQFLGVVYWEAGMQAIDAASEARVGQGFVELTGRARTQAR